MRFTSAAGVLALATSAAALDGSAQDANPAVWSSLNDATISKRSPFEMDRNRPFKRQSGWSPPSNMAGALKEVWDHCKSTYNNGNIFGFQNYGWDQLRANNGKVNFCVRWESDTAVTAEQRTKIATSLQKQYDHWFKWLYGYDNFPYSSIQVNVVGWAVKNRNLLQGDTSGLNIYTDVDDAGIPQCAESCGRFFHQDNNYSGCAAGAANHYDQSLWLTDGFGGGAGGDWGQRMGREYYMDAVDANDITILLHEQGHTFGLDDFYDWMPTGQTNFIMSAGTSNVITDFDGWMLRNWWYEISRSRGWQN